VQFKTTNPLMGDIGLVRISGLTGLAVDLGQRLSGSGSYFTHAFVVLDAEQDLIVQAQPGGAVVASLRETVGDRRVAYTDFALTSDQRLDIASAALSLIHTPYSFLDYPAIGLRRLLGISALERYVGDHGHLICSQLADLAYKRGGFDLFPGRLPGDVEPGDIARLVGAK
jgi:uncharacterized protein YycO